MVTRRDFLKLAGVGAASAGAALVGLPGSGRIAPRLSAGRRDVATLCNECPAGCALLIQVAGDRVLDVHSNPQHPLACPGACDGLESALRRLDAPQRLHGPLRRSAGRGAGFQEMGWPAAVALVNQVFTRYRAGEIAFVLGDFPDHLSDLVQRLALALGGASVLRYSRSSLLDGRVTLADASRRLFGLSRLPFFDLQHSDLVFSFGASGSEPWLARFAAPSSRPPSQTWVHFAPVRSSLAATSTGDEWVPIRPGSDALLALGLAQVIAYLQSGDFARPDIPPEVQAASQASGVSLDRIVGLARRFARAASPLALPGAGCLGQSAGLAAAQAVLALNLISGGLGRPGGMSLLPQAALNPELSGRTAALAELHALIERMQRGQVQALFVHGVDLLADLPAGLGVARALQKVERVISFNSMMDDLSGHADALLPDHLPLEGWGYQRLSPAADRPLVSALQPVFAWRYATRSTADVLLQAVQRLGGDLATRFSFHTEHEFIRQAIARLPWPLNTDPWQGWLAQGGWWNDRPALLPPVSLRPPHRLLRQARAPWVFAPSAAEFYLYFTQPPLIAAAGLCPVAMHPQAVRELDLRPGAVVRLASPSAEIAAVVVEQPALRPDTLAIPAAWRDHAGSSHPLDLVNGEQNQSGDLAYQSGRVRVIPV